MTFLLSLLEVYKCCIEGKNVCNMSLCNLSSIKILTAFNDFKEGFVNRIREKLKKKKKKRFSERQYIFWVGPFLGLVGRSMANQHFLRSTQPLVNLGQGRGLSISGVMYVFVYCRRALLGLNMRRVFNSIEVAEIGENKLACERDQAVDPREQDFDLIQVWNLKYEEVL